MGTSGAIAHHLRQTTFADLPPEVVEVTKHSILDAIGVMLAASSLGEPCQPFAQIASGGRSDDGATVLGFGFRATPALAAFANGSMAHALDYEDTFDAAMVHPNAAVVPAALAIAESEHDIGGRELITAVALGADLSCRLGLSGKRGPNGGRAYGASLAATAAAGKLLGLDEESYLHALTLSTFQGTFRSQAMNSGVSHMRGVRESFPAKAAVIATGLARGGVRAFDTPFEGTCDEDALTDNLGTAFLNRAVSFKPWPSCRGTHALIESARSLMAEHGFGASDVESAHVVISPFFRALCDPIERKQHPQTVIDAKFSVPFTLATTLLHGDVTLDSFSSDMLNDQSVHAMAERIDYDIDESIPDDDAARGTLHVRLGGGASFSATVVNPLGHPANPMQPSAVAEKFRACAQHARVPLSPGLADELSAAIGELEAVDDVRSLFARLG